jgi:regulation of enolase protein 1 (concanavalin A-like superfamily)
LWHTFGLVRLTTLERMSSVPALTFGLCMLIFIAGQGRASSQDQGEKVLFEERFDSGLSKGWQWVREEPKAWRVENGALVLRTLPGYLHANSNDSKNVLLRNLPDAKGEAVAIEVSLESEPKIQYEHAGLLWYYDDDNYVAIFEESLGGKPKLQMVTEKDAKAHFAVKTCESKIVWLRLVVRGHKIVSQYRAPQGTAWLTVGESMLPVRGKPKGGITSGGAPVHVERYAWFRDFRILELTK